MLIPSMVDVVEHINAADELLKCLTGKPEARFVLDAALQLPAIVALSMLRLQGALTDTVLSVILAVGAQPLASLLLVCKSCKL